MSTVKSEMAWDVIEASSAASVQGISPGDRARLKLADVLDLAGFAEDAEHLRKPIRIGDVMIPHTVAMAAMMVFFREDAQGGKIMPPLSTQIAALPIIQQIEIIQEVAAGKEWGQLANAFTEELDLALDALRRDAIDQAAAENDALHGKEVSTLEPAWVSPCGMGIGL